MMEGSGKVA